MTAQQLFDLSVAAMGITPSNATSYSEVIITQINTILAENFALENNNREVLGLSVLTTIPTVVALTDVLTYQDDIIRNVLVWGIAQLLSVSDGEFSMANFFGDKYETGRAKHNRLVHTEIVDFASGEE